MNERSMQDSIFWVEVERIKPNPFQPRRVFDEHALASLAESIRQYGVLQPLTVTRKEIEVLGEGIRVEYELIAGERRLRASKLAGVREVPVVIRTADDTDRMKLELAIIENLQREDLNAVDRAEAFQKLVNEFNLTHTEIGKKMGKSREYVSNTLRILMLPEDMRNALRAGSISEGHTRPLLMLNDKPQEQMVLFKDITNRRLTVRDAEALARRSALDKVRKGSLVAPDVLALEKQLSERLGTRVRIEKKDLGGKVTIDFFSPEDLTALCVSLVSQGIVVPASAPTSAIVSHEPQRELQETRSDTNVPVAPESAGQSLATEEHAHTEIVQPEIQPEPTPTPEEKPDFDDPELYSLQNFTV